MLKSDRTYSNKIIAKIDEGLDLARAAGVPREALESIATAREMLLTKNRYTNEACSDASEICKYIENQTYLHDWKTAFEEGKTPWYFRPIMVVADLEGQFLKALVSMSKAKRVLEVGMFTGYSAMSMAEALPADGEMVSLDICPYLEPLVNDLVRESPHRYKMKCIIGHATGEMRKMAARGEKFDVIFLDGEEKDYLYQCKIIFDKDLLNQGGTVLVDNAYFNGSVYTPPYASNPCTELVEEIKKREELHRIMLPINDGVLMIRRKADMEGETKVQ